MVGLLMDAVLMLLLVCAVGYGLRLEKKLTALRQGQLAFAGAVTELNAAAGRAEAALASLRASGQETDLLHDRIVKAREVKQELERLMARADRSPSAAPRSPAPTQRDQEETPAAEPEADDRALRMAALAQRIQGMNGGGTSAPAGNVGAILSALTANQAAKQSLNAARRSLDDDLFAA